MYDHTEESFVSFVRSIEPGLRVALVAGHGADRGREAANDALVYAWRHWDRVRTLDNPAGYLYRVGQRAARRRRVIPSVGFDRSSGRDPWVEPGLPAALMGLSTRQRQAVMLVEGYEFTFREVAALVGISLSSVQTHYERGMARLRTALGVRDDE